MLPRSPLLCLSVCLSCFRISVCLSLRALHAVLRPIFAWRQLCGETRVLVVVLPSSPLSSRPTDAGPFSRLDSVAASAGPVRSVGRCATFFKRRGGGSGLFQKPSSCQGPSFSSSPPFLLTALLLSPWAASASSIAVAAAAAALARKRDRLQDGEEEERAAWRE